MTQCPKGHTIVTIGGIDYCPPCELAERELERQTMTKDRRIEAARQALADLTPEERKLLLREVV